MLTRAALLRGLACLAPLRPFRAGAWCGEPFPPYAYSLPWFEFDVARGKLPVRVVGDRKAEVEQQMRPLLVLPSPGLGYEYLENLEALTISRRRVAFADLSGASSASVEMIAGQVVEVVTALEAPGGVHVLGHGGGAAVALRALGAAPGRIASLTLASPLGNLDDAEPSAREALAAGPAPLLRAAAASGRACVDAELGRLRKRSPTSGGTPLADGERLAAALAAAQPQVPVLLMRGAADVASAEAVEAASRAVPRLTRRDFDTGPLAVVDDRTRFAKELLDFLDGVDGTTSRRAVMSSGSMMPAGRL